MTTTTTKTTAAAVYQQLRGHLQDLKLADAAEALPKVLDQATAEGWTLTHALEHLLRPPARDRLRPAVGLECLVELASGVRPATDPHGGRAARRAPPRPR